MKKVLLAGVLGSLGVLVNSLAAQALDFNFTVVGDATNPGVLNGVIVGLTDNAFSAPTQIILNSSTVSPSGTVFTTNLNNGGFSVFMGVITFADVLFRNTTGTQQIFFNNPITTGSPGRNGASNTVNGVTVQNTGGFAGATFTQQPVPWEIDPAAGAALGVPLFIGLRILKKRSARKSTAIHTSETVS